MPIEIQLASPLGSLAPGSTAVSSLSQSLRSSKNPQSQALADALDELQRGIQKLENLLRQPPAIQGDDIQILNARGELGLKLDATHLYINGIQILGPQGASVPTVSGAAGPTYGATEQTLINGLITTVSALLNRLSLAAGGQGIIP